MNEVVKKSRLEFISSFVKWIESMVSADVMTLSADASDDEFGTRRDVFDSVDDTDTDDGVPVAIELEHCPDADTEFTEFFGISSQTFIWMHGMLLELLIDDCNERCGSSGLRVWTILLLPNDDAFL